MRVLVGRIGALFSSPFCLLLVSCFLTTVDDLGLGESDNSCRNWSCDPTVHLVKTRFRISSLYILSYFLSIGRPYSLPFYLRWVQLGIVCCQLLVAYY